ncbi:MAG: hypothetical protein JW738_09220 [Actinobacteria bacterium]|nr:hypothetical protein [Actinomycetota bacterium]
MENLKIVFNEMITALKDVVDTSTYSWGFLSGGINNTWYLSFVVNTMAAFRE